MRAQRAVKFVLAVSLVFLIAGQALGCGWRCTFGGAGWRCEYPSQPWQDSWGYCDPQGWAGCILGEFCEGQITSIKTERKLDIDRQMILDLSRQQPRLAMALVTLQQRGSIFNGARITSPPIRISRDDVRRALAATGTAGFEGNRVAEASTVYDVSWRLDSRTATLALDVVSGSAESLRDPHFEVDFVKTDIGGPAITTFKATNWRLARGHGSYGQAGSFLTGRRLVSPNTSWVTNFEIE